jgi:large subunit ribosomal protein L35
LPPALSGLALAGTLLYHPRLSQTARTGLDQGHACPLPERTQPHGAARARRHEPRMVQMPKLKTKSGVKKRFKVTGTGKILMRSNKFIRTARGTTVMFEGDAQIVRRWMPYGV